MDANGDAATIGRALGALRGLRLARSRAAQLLEIPVGRLAAGADRLGAGAELGLGELLTLALLLPDELPAARLWPRAGELVAGWLAAPQEAALVLAPDQVGLESDPLAIAFGLGSHTAIAVPLLEAAADLLARLAPRAPGGTRP